MVGDPAQTIYSFAGANAPTSATSQTLPRTTSIELVRNYRSTPEVIAAANQLLAGTAQPGVQLVAQRAPVPTVSYAEHADEVAEAEQVAGRILALRAAGAPAARDRGAVPDQRPVRGVRGGPRGARHPLRRPRRGPVLRPGRGAAGGHPAARQRPADGGSGDGAGRGRPGGARRRWAGPPRRRPAARQVRDRWESLQALVDQADDFAAEPARPPLGDFVDDLDRRASEQHAPVAEGVTLATLHAAKGLEWDAVFLAGMHEGTMPIVYAEGPRGDRGGAAPALRRDDPAREHLTVSWARPATPAAGRPASPRGS